MLVQYVRDMDEMNAAEAAYKVAMDRKMACDRQHGISRGAFGMFGYHEAKFFDRLKADIGEDVWTAAFAEARKAVDEDEDAEFDEDEEVPDEPVPEGAPTIREMVLVQLAEAGKDGTKAAPIRKFVEDKLGRKLHQKTIGMTLYRLSKDGLARSEGHTWFPVEAAAETGNPGAGTPGPEDGQHGKEDA